MKSTSTLDAALAYLANHPKRFIFRFRNGRKRADRLTKRLTSASAKCIG
jgi:hypothetical protein